MLIGGDGRTVVPPGGGKGGIIITPPPSRGGDGGGGGVVVPPVTPPPVTPPPVTPPPVTPPPVTAPPVTTPPGEGKNGGVKLNKISNDLIQGLFGTDLNGILDTDSLLSDYANLFRDDLQGLMPGRDPFKTLQKAFTAKTNATGMAPTAMLQGVNNNVTQNQMGLQNPTQINNLYQGMPMQQPPMMQDPLAGMSEADIGMRLQNRMIDPNDYIAHIYATGRTPTLADQAILGNLYSAPPPARSVGGNGGMPWQGIVGAGLKMAAPFVGGMYQQPSYDYGGYPQAQETVSGRILSGFNQGTGSSGAQGAPGMMADPFPQTEQEKFFGPNAIRLGEEDAKYQQMFDAVTMKPGGTPLYQRDPNFERDYSVFNSYDKAGDTGMQGEDLKRLIEKRRAYQAMTPDEQMRARQTGDGYFNNADTFALNNLMNNQSQTVSDAFNRLYGEQLGAGVNAILNNEGFSPNLKSWAALTQGNKTFSALGAGNNLMRSKLPDGNQLGNIVNRWSFAGVNPTEQLNAFANTRDSIMDEIQPEGGWQLQGYGYNSMGLGAGPGTGGNVAADESWKDAQAWGNYDDDFGGILKQPEWGNGVGYQQGAHAPTPFKNNSLLDTGGNGVTYTGVKGQSQPAYYNGPNGGSWSSPREPWNVLPGVNGSPQNAWGGPPAPYQLPPWQNGGGSYGVPHPRAGEPGDPFFNPNTQWYYQPGGPGYQAPEASYGGSYGGYQDGQMIASLYDANGDMLGTHRPQFYTIPGSGVARDDAFGGTNRWQTVPLQYQRKYLPFYRYQTNPFTSGQIIGRLS